MEYRTLGRTGMAVSPLCLGTMMFGKWGNPDHGDSIAVIQAALDAGINFVDTADVYSAGESEQIVAKALKGRRDAVVLATKCFMQMGEGPLRKGSSRRWIITACEESLRRLDTEWIDLYQVHRPDPSCDIDETLGALSDLIHQGKIRSAGSSTFSGAQIVEAQWVARDRNRERFVVEQPPYSILARGIEREVLPVCERFGIGVIPWSPLAGGWLSGRVLEPADAEKSTRRVRTAKRFDLTVPGNQAKYDAVVKLTALAKESGISLIHLAIAFVLNHPGVHSPIIGPRTMEQLDSQIGSIDVRLSDEILDEIDRIVPPGTNLNSADAGYDPPSITEPSLRRRGR